MSANKPTKTTPDSETSKTPANENKAPQSPEQKKLHPQLPTDPHELQQIIIRQSQSLQQKDASMASMQQQFAAASAAPKSQYQKLGDTSLVVVEDFAGIRETRRFDFETSLVTIATHYQYPKGQIVPKEMHMLEYTDTDSLERLRQKLIELGGTPKPLVDKIPMKMEKKTPYVPKKNPIGFHVPTPTKK